MRKLSCERRRYRRHPHGVRPRDQREIPIGQPEGVQDFLRDVDGGANLILDTVQGVNYDGGVVVVPGSEHYVDLERFLGLLGGST